MSSEDHAPLENMFNLFWGLHSLVHIAETVNCSTPETERATEELDKGKTFTAKEIKYVNEPGALKLVWTACKAIEKGADEKSGVHGPFTAYVRPFLKEKKTRNPPLQPYHGNRFNFSLRMLYMFSIER